MSYSGDAAEQVVRMSLEGSEVAIKLAGAGAKQLAILLYAILREQKKTKGKVRLTNMLRSGKELKVFAVKDSDLQLFCREAKKYGVLYCVLKDRDATDGITDIMVRAEDASKINRIFERFGLATLDMAEIRSEIERSRGGQENDAPEAPEAAEPMTEQELDELLDAMLSPAPEQAGELPVPECTAPEQDREDFLETVLGASSTREEGQTENPLMGPPQNREILWGEEEQGSAVNSTRQGGVNGADFATTKGRIEKSRQSEPTSKPKEPAAPGTSDPQERSRPSVRKELDAIKAEQREKAAKGKEQSKPTKGPKHKAPRKYKPKRLKER